RSFVISHLFCIFLQSSLYLLSQRCFFLSFSLFLSHSFFLILSFSFFLCSTQIGRCTSLSHLLHIHFTIHIEVHTTHLFLSLSRCTSGLGGCSSFHFLLAYMYGCMHA
ncbi:hypothetical protein CSUI_009106, partial [Cystoisospora suis]